MVDSRAGYSDASADREMEDSMTFFARVDKELCISSGKCVGDRPSHFRFDDDELAEAIPLVKIENPADFLAVVRNCPGDAISIVDDQGNEVAFR